MTWPKKAPLVRPARAALYPHLRVDIDAVESNARTMAAWCRSRGVELAPHVKTTMSEPIVARQAAAGATTMTVATVGQAATVLGWGYPVVLIANEVVDAGGLARLRALLEDNPRRSAGIFVDSEEALASAARAFAAPGPRLDVLIDVGAPGGRTGVRNRTDAHQLALAARRASGIRLVGVAGYEGVVPNRRDAATLAAVDAHCAAVRDVFLDIAYLVEVDAPIFSMGGSAFPDRVVVHLPDPGRVPAVRTLLRSGAYIATITACTPRWGRCPACGPPHACARSCYRYQNVGSPSSAPVSASSPTTPAHRSCLPRAQAPTPSHR